MRDMPYENAFPRGSPQEQAAHVAASGGTEVHRLDPVLVVSHVWRIRGTVKVHDRVFACGGAIRVTAGSGNSIERRMPAGEDVNRSP